MWPFHRHDWRLIGVDQGYFAFLGGAGTHLRYRCRTCPQVKTNTVNGHWTMAELTGEPS